MLGGKGRTISHRCSTIWATSREGAYTDFYRLAGECETPVYKKYNLAFGFNDGQVRVTKSVACLTSYRVGKKMRMVAK